LDRLIRSERVTAIDARDSLTVMSPDGSVRRFEGESAALARAVLRAFERPCSDDELRTELANEFDGLDESKAVLDELLKLLRGSGALVAPPPVPAKPLDGYRIVLAAGGAVASSTTPMVASTLTGLGAEVKVALTRSARRFVEPRALEAITHHPVELSLWDTPADRPAPHIAMAEWADAVVLAPATATTLSRIARGDCTDLVSALAISTEVPVLLAPSMNPRMLSAPAVVRNLERLRDDGFHVLWPGRGPEVAQAPKDRKNLSGPMPPPPQLASAIVAWVATNARPPVSSARYWESVYRHTAPGRLKWHRDDVDAELLAALDALPKGRLLDLGTGLGTVAAHAARTGHSVVATDVSRRALELAHQRYPADKIEWLEDDALASRLIAPFDTLIDRGLFHLLPPDRRADCLRELGRLTKPGGVVLLITHQHPAPTDAATHGFTIDQLRALFEPPFHLESNSPLSLSGAPALLTRWRRG
jgi:SAM-dependent methyltransferase